ncbi:hypothetical protein [Streptosporangium sp. NPDC048865]|uniref:hypothetical protein n=1 Tax=Streptosporangium sp. NPDC048865 TaxID=3155766 RepID=UPI003421DD00
MGIHHTPIILPSLASAPPAPPAGVSSLSARTDGRIYVRHGAAAAQPLLGVYARLASGLSKTGNSATDITQLQIAVQPGTFYFRYVLGYTVVTSGAAIRLAFIGPSASSFTGTINVYTNRDVPPTPQRMDVYTTLSTLSTAASSVATGVVLPAIMTARATFTAAGNITVRWAASAAGAQVNLEAGSYGVCWATQ